LPPLSFYDPDDPDLSVITELDLSFLNDFWRDCYVAWVEVLGWYILNL
jgi:hypothetical protein